MVDAEGESRAPPPFRQAYAGAGAPGDAGEMHAVLLAEDGTAYAAGSNRRGQLCRPPRDDDDDDDDRKYVFREVAGLPGPATAAAVGLEFTLFLLEDGRVFGCGSNEDGELGLGGDVATAPRPTEIAFPGVRRVEGIAAGLRFGLYAERGTGRAFGSGSNLFGQLCADTDGDPVTFPRVSEDEARRASRAKKCFAWSDGRAMSNTRRLEPSVPRKQVLSLEQSSFDL